MLAYLSILSVLSTFNDPVALTFVTILLASIGDDLSIKPYGSPLSEHLLLASAISYFLADVYDMYRAYLVMSCIYP